MGCSEKNKAMTSESTSPLPPVINWTWRIIVALPIEIGDFEHSYVNWSECQMVKLSGTIQEKTSHHLPNIMAYQGFVYSAWLFINNKFLRIGQHESPTCCSCLCWPQFAQRFGYPTVFFETNLLVFALSLYSISASGQDLLHAPSLASSHPTSGKILASPPISKRTDRASSHLMASQKRLTQPIEVDLMYLVNIKKKLLNMAIYSGFTQL